MNDYNFSTLNDKEFEIISADLLSKHLDTHIERFKPGKDGGVDGRFYSDKKKEVIIQCKHWVKSGTNALISHLKTKEFKKIKILSPSRYIVVTSVELSRHNKRTIKGNLSPYILSEADIIGREDLNSLLGEHPSIEERHYKLWLSSTTVLKCILSNGIFGRSASKLEEIEEKSSLYVQTENHINAINMLAKTHVAILTGEPGIGKSTLADHICLHYVNKGYQLITIENNLSEADDVYDKDPKTKQIFYFDDFLGRNYLIALQRHEDSHVVNFIKRVSRAKNRVFILTSRTNIFNQGKQLSELFYIDNIDRNEYELRIDSLTDIDKAKILYNHIWFSKLNGNYIQSIYNQKRYKIIINHNNYNPRLISFITDSHKISDIEEKYYWKYILETLQNPRDIWSHVFDQQTDSFSRALVKLVYYNGRHILDSDLQKAFNKYVEINNLTSHSNTPSDYNSTLKLVTGALINRNIDGLKNKIFYTLFNPSIGDYLLALDKSNKDTILYLFKSLDTLSSLDNLKSLKDSKVLSKSVYTHIINSLIEDKFSTEESSPNYRYRLAYSGVVLPRVSEATESIIVNFISTLKDTNHHTKNLREFSRLLLWGLSHINLDLKLEKYVCKELQIYIEEADDHDDFLLISEFIGKAPHKNIKLLENSLPPKVAKYWHDNIQDHIIENEIMVNHYDIDDLDTPYNLVVSEIEGKLSEYFTDMTSINVLYICDNCDLEDVIDQNIERETDAVINDMNYHHQSGAQENPSIDPIDDIFDQDGWTS